MPLSKVAFVSIANIYESSITRTVWPLNISFAASSRLLTFLHDAPVIEFLISSSKLDLSLPLFKSKILEIGFNKKSVTLSLLERVSLYM